MALNLMQKFVRLCSKLVVWYVQKLRRAYVEFRTSMLESVVTRLIKVQILVKKL